MEKSPQTPKPKTKSMQTTNQTLLAWAAPTSSFFNKLDKGALCDVGAAAAFRCKTPRGAPIPALVGDSKTARRVRAAFPRLSTTSDESPLEENKCLEKTSWIAAGFWLVRP